MHRYCAGVSVAKFEELSLETESSSSLHALKPFLCLYCEQQAHAQEVELLKSVIESLKVEIMDLRDSIRHIHPTTETVSLSSVVAPPTANPDRLVHGRNGGGRDGWGGGGAGGSGEHAIGECEGNAGGSGGWGGGCAPG